MTRVRQAARQTFGALAVRNFRLYFIGQTISITGTWMHAVALALLVLSHRIHGTGDDVGLVISLQFLPTLIFGTWGGLIADRMDKRRLLYVTQVASGLLALLLGLLVVTGAVRFWEIFVVATGFGVVNLFDNPARQSFVSEMVGGERLANAISLNSVLVNSARVVGPAIAAVLIYTVGLSANFLANAASYVAVIVALAMMRPEELIRRPPVVRAKGQVREGLRYVWSTPELRDPLLVMAVVGTFAFNFTTTLPLFATVTFHGGPGAYSWFTSAMGLGAVIGGLVVAHRGKTSMLGLSFIGLAFGVAILIVALAPVEWAALAELVVLGAFSIAFISASNSILQLESRPEMRGRVMSLYSIAFLGSAPIGAPLVGAISDWSSPRVALLVGAVATLVASVPLGMRYWRPLRTANTSSARGPVAVELEPLELD